MADNRLALHTACVQVLPPLGSMCGGIRYPLDQVISGCCHTFDDKRLVDGLRALALVGGAA